MLRDPMLASVRDTRIAVCGTLACGVGAPLLYMVGRVYAWAGFWPLPSQSRPYGQLVALQFALLLASLIVGVWPFPVVPCEPSTGRGRSASLASRWLLLAVPGWGLIASQAQLIEMPGDSAIWVNLADNPFIMTSEPLGRWSHYLCHCLLSALGNPSKLAAALLASVLAGCFQLAVLLLLTPRIFGSVRRALPWVAYLFFTPMLILNLGYAETTPWAYALLTASLLSGVLYARGPMAEPPVRTGLLLAVAIGAHGSLCFTAGGYAALLLAWLLTGRTGTAARGPLPLSRLLRAAGLAVLPFSLLLGTLLIATLIGTGLDGSPLFSNMFGGKDQRCFIAFWDSSDAGEYAFLSVRYWRDIANLLISACPVLPLAPFALIAVARRNRVEALYLGATLAGALVLTFFWNADLGIKRDFDLLSLFAVPAYLVTALWLAEVVQLQLRGAVLAVAIALAAVLSSVLPSIERRSVRRPHVSMNLAPSSTPLGNAISPVDAREHT